MASKLRVDHIEPVGGIPSGGGGGIIQVKSTTFTGTWSGSSGSNTFDNVDDLNTSITPTSTSSKILVMLTLGAWDSNGNDQRGGIRLVRDSTAICIGDAAGDRTRATCGMLGTNSNDIESGMSMTFLDSPNTTSAVTYKVQSMTEGNYTTYINRSSTDSDSTSVPRYASTMTLMEVSG